MHRFTWERQVSAVQLSTHGDEGCVMSNPDAEAEGVVQEYWKAQKVAVAPIPNFFGRLLNLLTTGQSEPLCLAID